LSAFEEAINVGDDLLAAAFTESGRVAEISAFSRVYARAAYAAARIGHRDRAFELLESGKARLLAEALSLRDVDTASLSETARVVLRSARNRVRQLEAEMRHRGSSIGRSTESDVATQLQGERRRLHELIAELQIEMPGFMSSELSLENMLCLVPKGGAIVAPVVTSAGTVAFVVPDRTKRLRRKHLVDFPSFTDEALRMLLVGDGENPGWLWVYRGREAWTERAASDLWERYVEMCTRRLWQHLMGGIHERLLALDVDLDAEVVILPQGGLALLPLHAASYDSSGGQRAFLDDFCVSFAPSLRALDVGRRRLEARRSRARPSLLAVTDPSLDLPFSPTEAMAVATAAPNGDVRQIAGAYATVETALSEAGARSHLHFACHGFYNWNSVMESGLLLADRQLLTLSDIVSRMDLDSNQLVVLSSCESGLSEYRTTPDEYVGLPSGFLLAGAPGVVSTLWSVSDDSCVEIVGRFYSLLFKENLTPAAALRGAQKWLRSGSAGEFGDFWHGLFTSMGENDPNAFRMMRYYRALPASHPCPRSVADWAAFIYTGS
jgi:CHAT domain-containing protein